ncbi:hypothetical protein ACOSP7_017528 [Xanthoceras sorbifolium]
MKLLTLSEALNSIDGFKSFSIDAICIIAEKFYPQDFTGDDINGLKRQLRHYKLDVLCQPQFQNITYLSELCHSLIAPLGADSSYLHSNNRTSIFSDKTYYDINSQ